MPYYMFFDPTYILVIIGVIITLIASSRVKSTFRKYSKLGSLSGETGASTAAKILEREGIYDVRIEQVSGNLTDHFDPRSKVLRLSESVYGSTSVAALGVAAHECGHAIQHEKGYTPLKVRTAIVPVVNIGTQISWPVILIGVLFGFNETLISIGILLFSLGVLFQLVTLPVEFNASNNALAMLDRTGILHRSELPSAKKVLRAAALTYVAAAAATILQLLRLLLLFGRRRD